MDCVLTVTSAGVGVAMSGTGSMDVWAGISTFVQVRPPLQNGAWAGRRRGAG